MDIVKYLVEKIRIDKQEIGIQRIQEYNKNELKGQENRKPFPCSICLAYGDILEVRLNSQMAYWRKVHSGK